ncbi:FecR family protein [Dinghuibacter silviterrae]|uniref:FecR family protein n=1 Tax=Dinghuibacter silviterrae TaxID=1539049 RepID=A0A4R8DTY4_9BACT|nr:FecR domain-containing protein [Dinghuibacter silviterrae]TDX00877.1 FecR family protein [Dinghuibacter silviterrae]
MTDDRFFYLAGRALSGEATPEERAELEENPEWKRIYTSLFVRRRPDPDEADRLAAQQAYAAHFVKMQLAGHFTEAPPGEPFAEAPAEPMIDTFDGAAEAAQGGDAWGPPARSQARQYAARSRVRWYAAVVTALLLGTGVWWALRDNTCKTCADTPPKSEIATRKGSRSRISLPDGSLVWLNADSRISYPDNFKGTKREVFLTGEAFFDVTKDAARPFVLHAGPVEIHVLGTRFDVRSYPREKKVETLLLHGSIEVTIRNQRKILLKPNQKLSVSTDNNEAPNKKTDTVSLGVGHPQVGDSSAIETLWVENKLAFESETLDVVAGDIERWYNVEVRIRNERLRTLRFTGVFEDQGLQEVMEALKLTGRFNYTIIGNKEVIIY